MLSQASCRAAADEPAAQHHDAGHLRRVGRRPGGYARDEPRQRLRPGPGAAEAPLSAAGMLLTFAASNTTLHKQRSLSLRSQYNSRHCLFKSSRQED